MKSKAIHTRKNLILWIFQQLKVHKSDQTKLFHFAGFYFLISITIGIMNSGVDALYLQHFNNSGGIPLLLILSSIGLILLFNVYGTFVDQVSKHVTYSISFGFLGLIFIVYTGIAAFFPLTNLDLQVLYILRFMFSVFLLIQFWDVCHHFFDLRQGKRLFPFITIAGGMGFALGSFLIISLFSLGGNVAIFLSVAILAFAVVIVIFYIKRVYRVVLIRNRPKNYFAELKEGWHQIRQTSFLRIFSLSTFIFGITAGLILYAFNNIVSNLITAPSDFFSFFGIWRGLAELLILVLQSTILINVMSQSEMGMDFLRGFLIRVGSALLLLFFFLFSMAATADFSRQILQAMVSPGALIALSVLPTSIRGRIMAFNNGVISITGLFIAGALLLPIIHFLEQVWSASLIYPLLLSVIFILIVSRIVINIRFNKAYVAVLAENLLKRSMHPSKVKENMEGIAANMILLKQFILDFSQWNRTIKIFLLNELRKYLSTQEQAEILAQLVPHETDEVLCLLLDILTDLPGNPLRDILHGLPTQPLVSVQSKVYQYRYVKGDHDEKTSIEHWAEQGLTSQTDPTEIQKVLSVIQNIQWVVAEDHLWAKLHNAIEAHQDWLINPLLETMVALKLPVVVPFLLDQLKQNPMDPLPLQWLKQIGSFITPLLLETYRQTDSQDTEYRRNLLSTLIAYSNKDISITQKLEQEFHRLVLGNADTHGSGADNTPKRSKKRTASMAFTPLRLSCAWYEEDLLVEIVSGFLEREDDLSFSTFEAMLHWVRYLSRRIYLNRNLMAQLHREPIPKGNNLLIKLLHDETKIYLKNMVQAGMVYYNDSNRATLTKTIFSLIQSESPLVHSQAIEMIETSGNAKINAYLVPFLEALSIEELAVRLPNAITQPVESLLERLMKWRLIQPYGEDAVWKKRIADHLIQFVRVAPKLN